MDVNIYEFGTRRQFYLMQADGWGLTPVFPELSRMHLGYEHRKEMIMKY